MLANCYSAKLVPMLLSSREQVLRPSVRSVFKSALAGEFNTCIINWTVRYPSFGENG